MPRPTLDFETFSTAGFVWNGPTERKPNGSWSAPAGATRKGLTTVNSRVYTEHPSTEVLTASYDLCDGRGLRRWQPRQPLPQDLFDHVAAGRPLFSHKAMFEREVWENVCTPKYGWPPLNPYAQRCSMATARVNQFPGALGKLGEVLALPIQKDKDGERLLKKFSIPRDPTKTDARWRLTPADDPADAERLYGYCDFDVMAEQAADDDPRNPPMSDDELLFWWIDQEINHRGIAVDRKAMADCRAVLDEALEHYRNECLKLTGGIGPGQVEALRGWLLGNQRVSIPNLRADTVRDYLGPDFTIELAEEYEGYSELASYEPAPGHISNRPRVPLPPLAKQALEYRARVGSASVKKLYAMENQASRADRLHNLIVHHGARTGRPTGEGPQPLNLPRNGPPLVVCGACGKPHRSDATACPWCNAPADPTRKGKWSWKHVDSVLEIMATRSLAIVEYFFGDALLAISGCLRGLFVAGPGKELIASDYSAIEAVVAACMAGEQWRIDTFRARKDIYLASASTITGITYEAYQAYYDQHGDHHPDRQHVGKVSELALGYGGWEGAWRAFDPDADSKSTPEIEAIIRAWRNASPRIVAMWGGQRVRGQWGWDDELFGIEGAVINAIKHPGDTFCPRLPSNMGGGRFPVSLQFFVTEPVAGWRILNMRLPSGRLIKYHQPELRPSEKRPGTLAISYTTWNSNPKYGMLGWVRMDTWGSRVFENADQAIAHDILRHAIIGLRAAGYPVVLHVYDEIVSEVPKGTGRLEEFESIMASKPDYARDWPIRAAGGWRGYRYRKG